MLKQSLKLVWCDEDTNDDEDEAFFFFFVVLQHLQVQTKSKNVALMTEGNERRKRRAKSGI